MAGSAGLVDNPRIGGVIPLSSAGERKNPFQRAFTSTDDCESDGLDAPCSDLREDSPFFGSLPPARTEES